MRPRETPPRPQEARRSGPQLLDKVRHELSNETAGQAAVPAVPMADGEAVIESVIIFQDVSRLAAIPRSSPD